MDNDELTRVLFDMNGKLGRIEEKVDTLTEKTDKQQEDIDELKSKPAKRWDAVVMTFVGSAIGAFIGYFFKR